MKPKWLLLIAVLVCIVTACNAKDSQGLPKDSLGPPKDFLGPPAEAYNNFFRACEAGDITKAETYLSEKAIDLLEYNRAEAAKMDEGDPFREFHLQWGDACFRYAHNGVNSNGIEFESDTPDAIRYWDLNTDELEEHTGEDIGYEGVLEMAALQWFYEGKLDPSGANAPSENTTYISTIEVVMIKINGEWKIDCGWC